MNNLTETRDTICWLSTDIFSWCTEICGYFNWR